MKFYIYTSCHSTRPTATSSSPIIFPLAEISPLPLPAGLSRETRPYSISHLFLSSLQNFEIFRFRNNTIRYFILWTSPATLLTWTRTLLRRFIFKPRRADDHPTSSRAMDQHGANPILIPMSLGLKIKAVVNGGICLLAPAHYQPTASMPPPNRNKVSITLP